MIKAAGKHGQSKSYFGHEHASSHRALSQLFFGCANSVRLAPSVQAIKSEGKNGLNAGDLEICHVQSSPSNIAPPRPPKNRPRRNPANKFNRASKIHAPKSQRPWLSFDDPIRSDQERTTEAHSEDHHSHLEQLHTHLKHFDYAYPPIIAWKVTAPAASTSPENSCVVI